MKKLICSVFILFCMFSVTAQAESREIAGVEIPDTITVDGNELKFNGGGIRSKWFMSLYVGSLYLPEETDNPDEVIGGEQPMAITLDIVSGMITSERMTDATIEGFENATSGNMEPIQEDVDAFMKNFEKEIKEGDHFRIAYLPEEGVVVYRNGEKTGTVKGGMDFKQALFAIWLGDSPAQESVKQAMLGKE
ncbi:chalcone isomerase-like protein [Halospina denitrificans]|uniref:Chalcone isomerase-like protein n=1 Tax=Halospina denitrificans TaxID=332522 RepID=A0A4R7K0W9_9GAMM|nr:chalcone isomerase family protein [Halospina denitrificans]TDT43089.1 chalcone isomerase-like protein [Halospina denitrificans]